LSGEKTDYSQLERKEKKRFPYRKKKVRCCWKKFYAKKTARVDPWGGAIAIDFTGA